MDGIPETMRAIDPEVPGGAEVLRVVERPVPTVGAGEVLIRVVAAGVNRPDVLQRKGGYPPPPGAPSIPGLEVSGIVVAQDPDVAIDMTGQPVCALLGGGGYAEYVAVAAGQVLPVPSALSMIEAAAIPETLFTVWTNLFERAYATEGDTVLVHGGTSGIGTDGDRARHHLRAARDRDGGIGREMRGGARPRRGVCDQLQDRGLRRPGKGHHRREGLRGGARHGRRGVCAAQSAVPGRWTGGTCRSRCQGGLMATIPIFEVMRRRLTLTGSTLRPRDAAFKSLVADELHRTVWPHVEAGAAEAGDRPDLPAWRKPPLRMRGWKRAIMSGRSC